MTPSLPTRAERFAKGKALRKVTPRAAHAKLVGPMERDSNAILEAQNASRLPALVPVRRQLLAENPFSYLRGAAAVMAQDLQWQPMAGAKVQACGDCHLMNFGACPTPENNILFDIDDFDETLPGVDFTVDIKRLAASIAVAGAEKKLARTERHAVAAAAVRAYRKRMEHISFMSPPEIWHLRVDLEREAKKFRSAPLRRKIASIIAAARGEGLDRDDNFPKLAESGAPVIHDKAPRIFHFPAGSDAAEGFDPDKDIAAYRDRLSPNFRILLDRFALRDFVFKAVGVGSVGTYCYVGLYMTGDDEPMFLQIKEASRSVLEALDERLAYNGHQGQRVVEGQRMMQTVSDILLGWTESHKTGRQFYVRVLKSRCLGGLSDIAEAEGLADYARLCGRALARSHARTGDPAVISGYMGDSDAFDEAIADFALAYEQRTEIDHEKWAATLPPPR
ncbi:MAG TPA: DUF2252 domain-containing protein [Rhodoblastus sp.]|nr:DUF2252 domain-containing protein [Rhodoblastus sp.]